MSRGEGIKQLSSLFDKYKKNLRAPQKSVIKAFSEVVYDVLGVTFKDSQVSYTPHNKTLSINSGGPIKSEVLMHKKELLNHLKGRLGETSAPKDII